MAEIINITDNDKNIKNNMIWCETVCQCCGGIALNSGWYSSKRIEKLKNELKEWKSTKNYKVICPDCYKNNQD